MAYILLNVGYGKGTYGTIKTAFDWRSMGFMNPCLIWDMGESSYCDLATQVGHLREKLIAICLVEMRLRGRFIPRFALEGYLGGHFMAFFHMSGILRGILFGGRAPERALYHIIVNIDLILINQA